MKKIKGMVAELNEELEGAKRYAECYVGKKAEGKAARAQRYHGMAEDELRHAGYIHEEIVEEIEKLRTVFTPPQEMMDAWEKDHVMYVEQAAWIKKMLDM